ncbi:MAG: cyclic nucleotide-binding domain-containing protein, partial [Burkholderiales bacterium]|nr:cyclic nucleotide-binding domain-containing protein [Burkholderiales bacterium]
MDFNPLNLFKQDSDSERFRSGDTVFSKGDQAENMYVLKGGEVDILVNGTVLHTASPGEILGEMALIDPKPRSATAVAMSDCELVPVDQKRFTFMIQHTPYFAIYVIRVLAERLSTTSSKHG